MLSFHYSESKRSQLIVEDVIIIIIIYSFGTLYLTHNLYQLVAPIRGLLNVNKVRKRKKKKVARSVNERHTFVMI